MINDFSTLGLLGQRLFGRPEAPPLPPGVPIGLTRQGQEVIWPSPSPEKASHVAVLAASGAGKTILVALAMLLEVALFPQLTALVIDPKGDLIAALLAGLAAVAPQRFSDIIYLNPFGGGFNFNLNKLALGKTPLDIRALQLANLVANLSTATGSQAHLGVGSRQVDVLLHCLLGALAVPHQQAHPILALDALVEPQGLKKLAKLTASTRAKQFLESAFLSDELRASCSSRLRTAFAASDNLEQLVTAPACLQFADLLSPGKIVLVDLGQPTGGLTALQELWANLLARLSIEHLAERPSPWPGHHVRIICDEAQVIAPVLTDCAERVLTTGRSRGVSLVVLSQGTALLEASDSSHTLLPVLMTNTPTRFIGRLAAQDAERLSRELAPGPGIDQSIGEVRGRFVGSVTNLKEQEFILLQPGQRQRFVSETVDLATWKQAEEAHQDEIKQVKSHYVLPTNLPPRLTLSKALKQAEEKKKPSMPRDHKKSSPLSRWG